MFNATEEFDYYDDYIETQPIVDTTNKKLTKDQARELINITKWLEGSQPFYVLAGSAGTGKTFLVDTIRQSIKNCKLTATTNKACGVLQRATGTFVTTIHSALALKLTRVEHELKLEQNVDNLKNNLWNVEVIIIDEASMLNEELMEYINQDVKMHNRKYIFVGDEAQLPPIGEVKSLIFGSTKYEPLTEIVRQGVGSPIITLATQVRNRINGDRTSKFTTNNINEIGSVTRMNELQFIEKIRESNFRDGACKVLSWTNTSVAHYNTLINEQYGIFDKPFDIDSLVLFNEAVTVRNDVVVANSTEGRILTMVEVAPEFNDDAYFYEVTVSGIKNDEYGNPMKFKVIPPEQKKVFEHHFNNLKQVALTNKSQWYQYYKAIEEYCDIRPVFASTVHKSQGSQWEEVFVDCTNILANKNQLEMLKMLYTAFTRSEKHLYLLWG